MPIVDRFESYGGTPLDGPAQHAEVVTPSDSTDLNYVTRGIYIGGTGNLKVTLQGGDIVTFSNISAGVVHPLRVVRVHATGTTATSIIGVH